MMLFFDGIFQRDASECFFKFLELLHIGTKYNLLGSDHLDENFEISLKKNLFGSIVKRILKCSRCQLDTIIDVSCFSFNIIPEKYFSVTELLTRSLKSTLSKRCTRCKKDTAHSENSIIAHNPSILVIVIKRFNFLNSATKNHDEIEIDHEIRINNAEFHLLALVHHFGSSTSSGHYTATTIYDNEYYHCY